MFYPKKFWGKTYIEVSLKVELYLIGFFVEKLVVSFLFQKLGLVYPQKFDFGGNFIYYQNQILATETELNFILNKHCL